MSTARPLSWRVRLANRMPADLAREIEIFETQIALKKQGKIADKVFAETRLRRGCYGQRYDNGQRYDGERTRSIDFPCGDRTKGPETVWDAPGMLRIKIPFGAMSAEQLEVLAEVAEEYSDAVLHVTTRQDIQLHYVHIDDSPDIMRRLAAAGITTREACGNTVRNVTACPRSGVCAGEAFDVTPYAQATARHLLGHPDTQSFGRKFKISFSGCAGEACGLAAIHDVGCIARSREGAGGAVERGFQVWVGGGLGAVPFQAKLFSDFVPVAEFLPLCQAICRVFTQHGEKRNRARARMKFVLEKLGIERFRELVEAERASMAAEERWTLWLDRIAPFDLPLKPPSEPAGTEAPPEGFEAWAVNNVSDQRQPGYATVILALPLGDLSAGQARALAGIARARTGDTLRNSVEQNILLRWVPKADLHALYLELRAVGLAQPGAGTLSDITACPGTDTCKLGISSSRGLAAELRERLASEGLDLDPAVRDFRIKISGCFNSCGQHNIADLGFYGVSRNFGGRKVAHFQVVLGGQWRHNASNYGLAVAAVPSKRIPEVVRRITRQYLDRRQGEESFLDYVGRVGKMAIRESLRDLMSVPSHDSDPTFFQDWGDPREYTIGDMGVGECAGEVVSASQFAFSDAERQVFEAQVHLDEGRPAEAGALAYRAMLSAAKALLKTQVLFVPDDPDTIVGEFETRFLRTKLFFDRFAGAKFGRYLVAEHGRIAERAAAAAEPGAGEAGRLAGEARLFIEAAHACHDRLAEAGKLTFSG